MCTTRLCQAVPLIPAAVPAPAGAPVHLALLTAPLLRCMRHESKLESVALPEFFCFFALRVFGLDLNPTCSTSTTYTSVAIVTSYGDTIMTLYTALKCTLPDVLLAWIVQGPESGKPDTGRRGRWPCFSTARPQQDASLSGAREHARGCLYVVHVPRIKHERIVTQWGLSA